MTEAFSLIPRPDTPPEYKREDIEQTFLAIEQELGEKHDRRGDLVLEPGKRIVLASDTNTQFALGVNASGYFTLTNYLTGVDQPLVVTAAQVEGAATVIEVSSLTARVETAEAGISTNASAIATETTARGTAIDAVRARTGGESPIPDWDHSDANFWGVPSGQGGVADSGPLWGLEGPLSSVQLLGGVGGLIHDVYSEYWTVEPGATYEIRLWWWNGYAGTSWLRPLLHVPGVAWSQVNNQGVAGSPSDSSYDLGVGAGLISYRWTAPATTNRVQLRMIADVIAGAETRHRFEMKKLGQYAETAILQDAFVDASTGRARAKIVLEAAASGSNPAELALVSGDGQAQARFKGDVIFDGGLSVQSLLKSNGGEGWARPLTLNVWNTIGVVVVPAGTTNPVVFSYSGVYYAQALLAGTHWSRLGLRLTRQVAGGSLADVGVSSNVSMTHHFGVGWETYQAFIRRWVSAGDASADTTFTLQAVPSASSTSFNIRIGGEQLLEAEERVVDALAVGSSNALSSSLAGALTTTMPTRKT